MRSSDAVLVAAADDRASHMVSHRLR